MAPQRHTMTLSFALVLLAGARLSSAAVGPTATSVSVGALPEIVPAAKSVQVKRKELIASVPSVTLEGQPLAAAASAAAASDSFLTDADIIGNLSDPATWQKDVDTAELEGAVEGLMAAGLEGSEEGEEGDEEDGEAEAKLAEDWAYFAGEMEAYGSEIASFAKEVASQVTTWSEKANSWAALAASRHPYNATLPHADVSSAPAYTADVSSYAAELARYAAEFAETARKTAVHGTVLATYAGEVKTNATGWAYAHFLTSHASTVAYHLSYLNMWATDLKSFSIAWFDNVNFVSTELVNGTVETVDVDDQASFLVSFANRIAAFAADWAGYASEIEEWSAEWAEYTEDLVGYELEQPEAEAEEAAGDLNSGSADSTCSADAGSCTACEVGTCGAPAEESDSAMEDAGAMRQ